MGGGAHHDGRDACRQRGGRFRLCCRVVDPHHDRRGEVLSSVASFPLTFPTIRPNVNRQPSLWAKRWQLGSGGGAIPTCPRRPHVLRARITTSLPLPAPLVGMSSSHVAISDVPILCSRCSFCGCSESSRLAQRHPKVFIRYIDVGHGGCDSLARFSGKKFVPRVQYATHFSARRSVEHALLLTY